MKARLVWRNIASTDAREGDMGGVLGNGLWEGKAEQQEQEEKGHEENEADLHVTISGKRSNNTFESMYHFSSRVLRTYGGREL